MGFDEFKDICIHMMADKVHAQPSDIRVQGACTSEPCFGIVLLYDKYRGEYNQLPDDGDIEEHIWAELT